MDHHTEILHLDWQGIAIEISFTPDWSRAYREVYGHPLTHIEVRAENKQPLPITETGYYSLFVPACEVEENGGPLAYVKTWLDVNAESDDWKEYCEEQRQGSLF